MQNFAKFITRSPTVYHAAKEIALHLDEAEFTPLVETERWNLESGKGYYLMRDNALIAAFRMPKKKASFATILASHIDSPCLKIKPHPQICSHEMQLIGTEVYGGPLLYTWLDRDLAIAGRIVVDDCESKLVFLDDFPVTIPSLPIHLDKSINEKGFLVHKQDHLKAIFSVQKKELSFSDALKKYQSFQNLLSFDLFLVPIEKGAFLGQSHELFASYRLDNLTSAFASLFAITNAKPHDEMIQMAYFWDHEEIGSKTFAGADSVFASQILERICSKLDREDLYRLKAASLCISCDVGHGFNPNFSDKYDHQNAVYLGKGPALKFSSKYATNGSTAAAIVKIAQAKKIPYQMFASRSDISSGSTVGALMAATLGIATVDLGIGCLAMHSVREVIHCQDQKWLCDLLQHALEAHSAPF